MKEIRNDKGDAVYTVHSDLDLAMEFLTKPHHPKYCKFSWGMMGIIGFFLFILPGGMWLWHLLDPKEIQLAVPLALSIWGWIVGLIGLSINLKDHKRYVDWKKNNKNGVMDNED